ncbi:MAG: acyloxyacyl hydrolase [Holosporales bacterium]|jgi:hypothetical protein|nr:acyloxyacyl hydrolase [Holosporales bacterium]
MSKKFYKLIFSVTFLIMSFANGAPNTIFDKYENQFVFHVSQSIKKGKLDSKQDRFETLYNLMLQYSQPNDCFRLFGRRNFEIIAFIGGQAKKVNYSKYNQMLMGISQDIYFPIAEHFYFGAGLGGYIKTKVTDRISSIVTFGEKFFIGYQFNDKRIITELYIKHFSNGKLTPINKGQNFVGFAMLYNF